MFIFNPQEDDIILPKGEICHFVISSVNIVYISRHSDKINKPLHGNIHSLVSLYCALNADLHKWTVKNLIRLDGHMPRLI